MTVHRTTSDDLEADSANELYLAVAAMRAHSGRMRALAERIAEADAPGAAPETPPSRDYERELFGARPRAGDDPKQFIGYHPYLGHIDAAAEHLQRARLPDLNTLAELMMRMKGAQHAYEINMQMLDATHDVMARTVDLLRR
jgi:flagellar basal body rod protein FlgC